jgi:hypothetical protein
MTTPPYTLGGNAGVGYPAHQVVDGNLDVIDVYGTGQYGNITARSVNAALTGLQPSGDTTGTIDAASIAVLLALAGKVTLSAGTFYGNITLTAGQWLAGAGSGLTILTMPAGSASPVVSMTGNYAKLTDLTVSGGTGIVLNNPQQNGVEITAAQHCKISGVFFEFINGWAIESAASGSTFNSDTMLSQIICRNCAGGIHVLGNTGSSFHAEHFLTDITVQQNGVASGGAANLDAVMLEDCQDVLIENLNTGFAASNPGSGSGLHVKGACSSISVSNPDLGGNPNAPVFLIEDGTNGSPAGVKAANGICQDGLTGQSITGGATRVGTINILFYNNQTHGVSFTGSGFAIHWNECSFNLNNAANGTGYDFFGNGTAKMSVKDCVFQTTVGGSGVTNPCNFPGSGSVVFENNEFHGTNTTVTNAFATAPTIVRNCSNYNPVGAKTISVPASGTPTTALTSDVVFSITAATGGCTVAVTAAGTTGTVTIPAGACVPVSVPASKLVTLTYTNAPTWVVYVL